MSKKKNVWDGHDEFSFDFSEDEFNRQHKKALKDAEPSGKKKKKRKKKAKVYAPNPIFRGLGSGGSRGPWPK